MGRAHRTLAAVAIAAVAVVVGVTLVPTAAWAAEDDSIEGTVRYLGDSQPIAGALVEFFDAAGDGLTPVTSVVSAADGTYVVSGLPFGSYKIRYSAEPTLYMPQWYYQRASFAEAQGIDLVDGSHPTGIDVYLTDATDSIEGTVRYLGDSQPIAGALVEFFDAAGDGLTPVTSVVSAADGTYVVSGLPFGSYKIRYSAEPTLYMPQWYYQRASFAEAQGIDLVDGSHPTGIDVYLTDATDSIEGTVRYLGDSQPIAGALVEFFDAAGDGLTPVTSVVSAADGTYVVSGLPFGSYKIRYSAEPTLYMPQWYYQRASFAEAQGIDLVDGSHPTGIDVYLTDATDSIEGTVRYLGDSQPIAGALVEFFDAAGDGLTPVTSVVSAADGTYRVEALPYGDYKIRVSTGSTHEPQWYYQRATFATADAIFIADGSHPSGIDVYLTDPIDHVDPELRGTITDGEVWAPLAGATIRVYAADGDGTTALATTTTDAAGQYTVEGLDPAVYKVSASAPGKLTQWYYGATTFADAYEIDASGGGVFDYLDVTLYGTTTSVSGTVRDAASGDGMPGVTVDLYYADPASDDPVFTTTTGADGGYVFADLPEADYQVHFSAGPDAEDSEWWAGQEQRANAYWLTIYSTSHYTDIDAYLGDSVGPQWIYGPIPEITGTPAPGSLLSAVVGPWDPTPTSFSYQWSRNGVEIIGATTASYVVLATDRGAEITVAVTAHKAGYPAETRWSAPSAIPAFSTSDLAAAMDADGTMALGIEADGRGYTVGTTPIAGFPRHGGSYGVISTGDAADAMAAHDPEYGLSSTLTDGPRGASGNDLTRLTLTLSPPAGASCLAVDFAFASEEYPQFVGTSFNDVFTVEAPTTDITVAGDVVTAPNNYAVDTGGRIISVNSVVGFAPIAGNGINGWTAGLTAKTPLITVGGVTKAIISLQDLGDNALDSIVLLDNLRYLGASDCAGGGATPIDPIVGPTPTITGTASTCTVLTADAGSWSPAPVTLGYQWKVGGVAVVGATGSTFAVPTDAAGSTVTVAVTGTKPGYLPVTKTSAPTASVTQCQLTGPVPTVTGTPTVGSTLTATPGSWAPAPVGLAYQWFRNSVAITGATSSSYVLVAADAGTSVSVTVTGSKTGYTDLVRTSAAVAVTSPLTLAPTPTPTISGTAVVDGVLTATPGTWGPAPVALAYQWLRGGSPIAGATTVSYTATPADAGTVLTVAVTGSKTGYPSATRTSAGTAVVALGALTTGAPTLTGAATACGVLTVTPGTWTPAPVALSYRWFVGAVEQVGATSATFAVPVSAVGSSVTASVTGTKNGYAVASVATAPSPAVALCALTAQTPTITGTPAIGSTLAFSMTAWAPAPITQTVQWKRDGIAIAGATGATYAVVVADAGTAITVTVNGSKLGYADAARTSAAVTVPVQVLSPTPNPTISGTAVVDGVLTATPGTWGPAPVALAYQWLRGGSPIAGATAVSYTVTPADVGTVLAVSVTGSKAGYPDVTRPSAGTAVVVMASLVGVTPVLSGAATACGVLTVLPGAWTPAPVALSYRWYVGGNEQPGATGPTFAVPVSAVGSTITASVTGTKPGYVVASLTTTASATVTLCALAPQTPTITGTPAVGSTLGYSMADWGPAPVTKTVQWKRDGAAIAGATGATYTVVAADAGHTLTVTVSGSKVGYATEPRTSTPVTVPAQLLLAPTPTPTITGTAQVGRTLTAVAGTWGPAPVTLTYQWLRNGVAIVGATGATLTLLPAHLGGTITVAVTGSKAGYPSVTRTSPATASVIAGALTAPTPTITGTPQVGKVLTAVAGTWGPPPVALSYQWLRNGVAITGATAVSYTPTVADIGAKISVRVTGTKSGYGTVSRTSAQTVAVVAGVLTAPTPTISGSVFVGSTLTANPGTWAPAPVALTYQWRANGVAISGATGKTFVITTAQVGKTITVTVTGKKSGYTTASRTSAATAKVPTPLLSPAPTPTISGTARYGSTLTAIPGTWGPTPVTLKYQWLRNNAVISGATSVTYVIPSGDIGAKLSVRVVGSKTGYPSLTRTSAPTAAVVPKPFTTAPVPTISGTLRVANTLTANPGTWSPAATDFDYQWYRSGTAIPGATGKTWLLNGADAGDKITVKVTAKRSLYATTSRTSAATAAILPGLMTATPTPWITGTAKVGQTLSVHTGQWEPTPVPVVFTWRRNGVAIAGASGGSDHWTYKLVKADVGATITCTVVSTKTGYVSVTKTTAKTAVVKP